AERQGTQEWLWTATFEAFDAWPKADVPGGQVPAGTYRFLINGHIHQGGQSVEYKDLSSAPFEVQPWDGLKASDPTVDGGDVVVQTDPVVYPRTYTADASFPWVKDDGGDKPGSGSNFCKTCSF